MAQLPLRLVRAEPHELHVLTDLLDRVLDAEYAPPDHDGARQVIEIDERDARLRVRVARDEPDEHRDHERVGEERPEEERRAPEDAQILREQERNASHTNISST